MGLATKVDNNLTKESWRSYNERQITGFISTRQHISWIRDAVDTFYDTHEARADRAAARSQSSSIRIDIPLQILLTFITHLLEK